MLRLFGFVLIAETNLRHKNDLVLAAPTNARMKLCATLSEEPMCRDYHI
jgi:hypothetical protein